MGNIYRLLPFGLVLISTGLLCWGFLGLLEYFIPSISLGLQNGEFPAGLQFLHFFAILITGVIFVFGYFTHWRHTPYATISMYMVLATLCFIETIDFGAFGGGTTALLIMTLEFTLYLVLSVYLLRSPTIHHRFHSGDASDHAA